ncbi:protein kinase domain-containing protein [Pseudomonas sp. B21-048]|uniref:protein kinase domain-containing protein n=1 Tax=Pseudomonas sp. B21-048 TaxID=2895490 RepID=UPI00215F532F|nr:hypothetical protein [Pseudomonas sp. B21-048]UVK97913.1 hypothetical protein LOY56_21695 [Pseudomonas sp. B21-048]
MEHVLVDKSVLFLDPDIINRIRGKNGLPFISHSDLLELQSLTKGLEQVHKNARQFFQFFASQPSRSHRALPKGTALRPGDLLAECAFDGHPIFFLKRTTEPQDQTPSGDAVDFCRHYDLLLLTCDEAQLTQCKATDARAQRWIGRAEKNGEGTLPPIMPFELPQKPLTTADSRIHNKGASVTESSVVTTSSGRRLTLNKSISSGGEGTIYAVAGNAEVCKIYHPEKLTERRRKKVELMVTRRVVEPGICWPNELVFNTQKEFVGYVMPRAEGKTLQATVFVKPLLARTFPRWTRRDLVNVAVAFLKQVQYLHSLNIIVGDINPNNLLVTPDSTKVWMVDTDSFQIDHFPCEVGTVPFTAPEIQGEKYGNYLRTKDHELFAIATMLFMIMLPGKPPYSQQGGGTAADNIKNMNFPYRFKKDSGKGKVSVTPVGAWQHIWSHLPYPLKQAFSNTFEDNQRQPIGDWLTLLTQYGEELLKGKHSDELFPAAFHINNPVEAVCGSCKKTYTESKAWLKKRQAVGGSTQCADCQKASKLKKLARESQKKTKLAEQRAAPPPAATTPQPNPTPVRNIAAPAPAPRRTAPATATVRQASTRPQQQQPTSARPQPYRSMPTHAPNQEGMVVRWFKRLLKHFL